MKTLLMILCLGIGSLQTFAQHDKINRLIHTKLDVRFDYARCYLYGKEWVTMAPQGGVTDTVRLDAKGMDIRSVSLVGGGSKRSLRYSYDGTALLVKLHRRYNVGERFSLYIEYVSKPNELQGRHKDEKGLYFINPDSSEEKPVQIWTEGEPENSSTWFPTIDDPGQKTTEEILMTVPEKYVTLSNGRLVSQRRNHDGTRTDEWKMDKPNAPYLFMMAVGDFRIYKDSWRGKEVSYYLEPRFTAYARDMFGETPAAIEFFSGITGVPYPWNKYSQIVVRDYVSGAMENTTACMMGEPAQATTRELADRYYGTGIQHELFHQWFGDYVTAKDWANLCMNESFADLGELLWLEYRYGADAAGEHWLQGLRGYLGDTANFGRPLVNYGLQHPRDAFNAVAYQKGGRILYMLRNFLGNEIFYKGLHFYLVDNAYKNAGAEHLQTAMEKASGLGLGWFFKQWFYGAGHPVLDISYQWDDLRKIETVVVKQKQAGGVFILPVTIDVYSGGRVEHRKVWLKGREDSVQFALVERPLLVNVDAEKTLVCQKEDHKSMTEWSYLWRLGLMFMDRCEAVDAAAADLRNDTARGLIAAGLRDPFSGIREKSLGLLGDSSLLSFCLPWVARIAESDSNTLLMAKAINVLSGLRDTAYRAVFVKALGSVSYVVQGAALEALGRVDPAMALRCAKPLEKDNLGPLTKSIVRLYAAAGGEGEWAFVYNRFVNGTVREKVQLIDDLTTMICRIEDPMLAGRGIELLKETAVKYRKKGAGKYVQGLLKRVEEARSAVGDRVSAEACRVAIEGIDKSGD